MFEQRAIAVIHARGGSKRFPLKNLAVLAGKPLIAYPIDLCRKSEWIQRIVVSTDHDGIMEAAEKYGAEVPFRRPADISEDVPSELVTYHALQHLVAKGDVLPEFVVTLTPATPLTKQETLEEAYRLICLHELWDSVTAVRPAKEHPEWMLRVDDEIKEVRTLLGNPLDSRYNVSQNLDKFYYPAGSFWINRISIFMQKRVLYGEHWGAVVLSPEEMVDIDWPEDLAKAEEIMDKRDKGKRS